MKRLKPSDADMSRRADISATRQRHYDAVARGETQTSGAADGHVGKGPRGKWYVKRGKEIMEGPFETEAKAKAAMADDDVARGQQSV
jgi:hypothetical protein